MEPTQAPVFITPLSNVMARAGQKIKLECEVAGLPQPTLTWSHNGKPVKETREIKVSVLSFSQFLLFFGFSVISSPQFNDHSFHI